MGAGSAVFSRQLMIDILLIPGMDRGSFALPTISSTLSRSMVCKPFAWTTTSP
jgi:hypothetical protein